MFFSPFYSLILNLNVYFEVKVKIIKTFLYKKTIIEVNYMNGVRI
jgi:hypothetical protein